MTTFFAHTTAADRGIRTTLKSFATRATAAVHDARARAKARGDYRQMLDCEDHFLRDVGLTRADIRNAYRECGGRG